MADPIPKYPLYDATFTAYRLSPLYHGSNILLDEMTLRMHARRFRDILRGDNLRGVDIGAGSTDSSTSGTLESCNWDLFGDEAAWERQHNPSTAADEQQETPGDLTDAPTLDPASTRGIHISLRYQTATHTALLLRDPSTTPTSPTTGFTSLPLLLTRMPAPLRNALTTYLATSFDTRPTPLALPPSFLSTTLESLLAAAPPLPSRLHLQLSFPTTTTALRTLDLTLPRPPDLLAFLDRGTAVPQSTTGIISGPFTDALARYLRAHLALDIAHPGVGLAKVALPPVVAVGGEGRVKVFEPVGEEGRAVVEGVYGALVGVAARRGEGKVVVVVGRGKADGAKGKKRALGVGDANKGGKGVGKGKKRVRRESEGDGDEEAEEEREGEQENEDADADADADEDDVVAGSARPGRRGGRGGTLSVPKEPPPPYELHDPARVAGGL